MLIQKANKEYTVRSYEGDKYGNLRIVAMMNIFQDIADIHAAEMGLGMDYCKERSLAWIGANYHLVIESFPQIHQQIMVRSWPSAEKKLGTYRDYVIEDKNGNIMVRASCQWVLINFIKKRPVSLRENLPQYQAIEERAVETNFPKIEDINHCDYNIDFKIRFDDIDFNNHVNNAVYPLWATEAVPEDFRLKHFPQELEIAFKKEALFGEIVHVESEINNMQTLHVITSTADKRELAKVKIKWRESTYHNIL